MLDEVGKRQLVYVQIDYVVDKNISKFQGV